MRTTTTALLLVLGVAGCGENRTEPPERDGYGGGDVAPLDCVPNLDGRIDAREFEAVFDVPVSYLVSPAGEERAVDLAGKKDSEGHLVWDFSADYASDRLVKLRATEVTGKWYAASFPRGQFVTPTDAAGKLEGVYTADDDAISLLGVASKDEDPAEGKTLLVYAEPVPLYRFPLEPGASWTATGEVVAGEENMIGGLPYAGTDTYEVKDDGVGRLELQNLIFGQVHRVRTRVRLEPAVGAAVSFLQVGFVFECFGEITRATSHLGETEENFKTAAELRRLGE